MICQSICWNGFIELPAKTFGGNGLTGALGWALFLGRHWHIINPLRLTGVRKGVVTSYHFLLGFCGWGNRDVIIWVLWQTWWNCIYLCTKTVSISIRLRVVPRHPTRALCCHNVELLVISKVSKYAVNNHTYVITLLDYKCKCTGFIAYLESFWGIYWYCHGWFVYMC